MLTADLSRERRRWAEQALRASSDTIESLGRTDRLVYAVALLVARDEGDGLVLDEGEWSSALEDPSTIQTAANLLVRAGYAEVVR